MNAALLNSLESAKALLDSAEHRAVNETVKYEINTARIHIQRAIEWEKSLATVTEEVTRNNK